MEKFKSYKMAFLRFTRSHKQWFAVLTVACFAFFGVLITGLSKASEETLPLNDLGTATYKGFQGGLYPGGINTIPQSHLNVGVNLANSIQPLDVNGNPSPNGKYVLLSVGVSNTADEFCTRHKTTGCDSGSFMAQAALDSEIDKSKLVLVNGAIAGADAVAWDSPTDSSYLTVKNKRLAALGVSEKQVQAIWLKQTNKYPTPPILPDANAEAYRLETNLGNVVRSLKIRYPNLKVVFLSSRIYAGYATTTLSPEPYVYENGFSMKWLIQAQIDQMQNGGQVVDSRAGDLNYNSVAPWIAWGPYLWANGTTPRSDGLVWTTQDFIYDGTHPSPDGVQKVGDILINFFKTFPSTTPWFLAGEPQPPDTTPPTISITAPANGQTVSDVTTISTTATDNIGVSKVDLFIDGVFKISDSFYPFNFNWDSRTVANGSHTLLVKAYDQAGNAAESTPVVVNVNNAAATLTVSLQASPSTGTGSLLDVDLSATVGGTAIGTINYYFYCNRSDSGTDIQSDWAASYLNNRFATKTAVDVCDYTTPGVYTAKVIVQRAGLSAEARVTVTVN